MPPTLLANIIIAPVERSMIPDVKIKIKPSTTKAGTIELVRIASILDAVRNLQSVIALKMI